MTLGVNFKPWSICDFPWNNRQLFSFWHYLVCNKRRILGKPCVLPIGLAMGEARIYEQTILRWAREDFDGAKHLPPEICFEWWFNHHWSCDFSWNGMGHQKLKAQVIIADWFFNLGGIPSVMNCSVRGLVCSWPKCREDQPKLGQDWIVAVETMKEIQDQCKRTSIELLNLVILIWKGKKI